jgi:alpha-L-fucosidase
MKRTLAWGLAAALALPAAAQDRLTWWTDARFGMFIHWGIYTVPAGEWNGKPVAGLGEWIMNHARIPIPEYEKLAGQFNPLDFDADKWVAIAKNAGMKYITITAKHHDGFAMFGSKVSGYNIVDATPFHRDPMKELAAACQRAGLKLCFYYSQTQDWHESDGVGNDWDYPAGPREFQKYLDEKVIPQVRELLTNYGPIGLIWFDTPRNITPEQSQRLADLVHQLQPDCLVSGRVGNGLGDYDSAGDNQISMGGAKRPWETPVTINDTWGFKNDDRNFKSAQVLIRQLATTASRGGNYLLNVGPTSLGVIPPEEVERLTEMGKWTRANGDSIYATSGNPYPYDVSWGVVTSKPGRLYLHVFQWPGKELVMYGLESKVTHASLLATGAAVRFKQKDDAKAGYTSLALTLPDAAPDPNDSVIVLDVAGKVTIDPSLAQQPDGSITLPPLLGEMHKSEGSELRLDSRGVTERWMRATDWIDWRYKLNHPGEFEVEMITSQQKYGNGWDGGQRIAVRAGDQEMAVTVEDNGKEVNPANPYWPYVVTKLGRVKLSQTGSYTMSLKPQSIPDGQKYGLTLVSIRITPIK